MSSGKTKGEGWVHRVTTPHSVTVTTVPGWEHQNICSYKKKKKEDDFYIGPWGSVWVVLGLQVKHLNC